jgi:ATP-dependent Lon protease
MNVYEIAAPDEAGARRIAASIYRELRTEHAWGQLFPEQLSDDALDRLAHLKPREMRRVALSAFGAAKLAGRHVVLPEDIAEDRASRRPRIGF